MAAVTTWLAKATRDPAQRKLLAASFADALGTGLFLPLSVIYLTRIVGLSPARAGLGLTIAGVLAIAASPMSGALLGRFGARKVVLGCFAASACRVPRVHRRRLVRLVPRRGDRDPVRQPYGAARHGRADARRDTAPQATRRARVAAVAPQLGYGLGGLLAALALLVHGKTPFVVLLAANAASYIWPDCSFSDCRRSCRPSARKGTGRLPGGHPRSRYMGLALLNVIMALHDSLLLVAMPLWIVTRTRAPLPLTGLLFALNTVLVVLFQVRTTRNIAARGGIARGYRTAAVSFVARVRRFRSGRRSARRRRDRAARLRARRADERGTGHLGRRMVPVRATSRQRESARYISVFKTSMAVQQAAGPPSSPPRSPAGGG